MTVFTNIFLLIAAIFAIGTLIYVVVDVINEKRRNSSHTHDEESTS